MTDERYKPSPSFYARLEKERLGCALAVVGFVVLFLLVAWIAGGR